MTAEAVPTSTAEAYIKSFKDKFSNHASDYASYRPEYPESLAEFLSEQVPTKSIAVDVACGSGQLTKSLGAYFDEVYGFDASAEQIDKAMAQSNITYAVAQAESLPLADNSVDIITIAQALHWFDIDSFWQEANRIGKNNSIIAAICYNLCKVSDELNPLITEFYESLKPYWAAERSLVETAYSTINFPFEELPSPPFFIRQNWNCSQFLSYISTWSAVKESEKNNETHFLDFKKTLQSLWDFAEYKEIIFPVSMRLGRITN